MKKFGFGESFIHLVEILHNDIYSAVLNNGSLGDWFKLSRSTRQGCPASALTFLTVVEALGLKIRQELAGISIDAVEYKAGQYADDLWSLLHPSAENIDRLLHILRKFHEFSGLKINLKKSYAMKVGPCRYTDAKYYTQTQLVWVEDPIKILGVWIHPDFNLMVKCNFFDKLPSIKDTLQLWSKRNLTTLGKITVINSLIISQFNYQLASVITPSQTFYREFKKIITNFIWEGKIPKVSYLKLIQDYNHHRLKLVDMSTRELALKAKWPLYFGDRHEPFLYWSAPVNDHRIWQTNTEQKHINMLAMTKIKNQIFLDIWKAWSQINYIVPTESEEILTQLIHGNSHILRAGVPLFQKELVNLPISFVLEIFKENGEIMSYQEFCENMNGPTINIMLYNVIKVALPAAWKILIRERSQSTVELLTKWEKLERTKKTVKEFY